MELHFERIAFFVDRFAVFVSVGALKRHSSVADRAQRELTELSNAKLGFVSRVWTRGRIHNYLLAE